MSKVNKDTQRGYFYEGAFPTDVQMQNVVESQMGVLESVADLSAASADNLGQEYKIGNQFYKSVLEDGVYKWKTDTGAVPSVDYEEMQNKPKINGVLLTKDTSSGDIGVLSNDMAGVKEITELQDDDTVYVSSGGTQYKATVETLRKPNSQQVEIAATDWKEDGDGYMAEEELQGVYEGSDVICTPAPESVEVFLKVPFWAASLAKDTIVFRTQTKMDANVKANIIWW